MNDHDTKVQALELELKEARSLISELRGHWWTDRVSRKPILKGIWDRLRAYDDRHGARP